MKINLSNYEEYLVRLIEGDLSAEEQLELHNFLEANSELKMELDAFRSAIAVPDETVHFLGKENLLQPDQSEMIVRYIERELNQNELLRFQHKLSTDSVLQKELESYRKAILLPDYAVVFPDKEFLKRRSGGRLIPMYVRYLSVSAVAAALLLLFLFKGTEQNNDQFIEPTVTENSSTGKINSETVPDNTANSLQNTNQSTIVEKLKENIQSNPIHLTDYSDGIERPGINPGTKEVFASISPLHLASVDHIAYDRKMKRAPILVPYREEETIQQPNDQNTFSSPILSIASLVGSELLRLSGREGWLNENNAEVQKVKGPIKFSFETKKFSLKHTFRKNKKNTS